MDRGTWWAAVHGVAKSLPRLSTSAATVYEGSLFSTSSPTFVICVLFFLCILTGVRKYLIVILFCIFFMINDVEHLFMCLLAIYLSWENVCSGVLPILNCFFDVYLMSSLDINPLPDASIADTLSHLEAAFFIYSFFLKKSV